jgi:hypothetical protein
MMKILRTCLILTLFLCLPVATASASLYLTQSAVNPDTTPILSGSPAQLTATITIVPSGATTFSRDNTLQMSTNLDQAFWHATVVVNGHQAAVFNQAGPVLFINGYLLSYPSTSSVAIDVQINGFAPMVNNQQQSNFLTVVELNNINVVVPGSTLTVTRAVSPEVTPTSPVNPVPTTVLPTQTTATAIPGFNTFAAIAAVGILAIAYHRKTR